MEIKSRIARIERIGKWLSVFFAQDMIQSGLKLIDIQIALANFASKNTLYKLNLELTALIEYEFKNERKSYKGFHRHRTDCFNLMHPKITTLLGSNISLLQNWIASDEVTQIIEQRTNAQKIWGKIINIIKENKNKDDEEKIIELNLLYLAIYEGMFEKDVKICYCFLEMSKGISIDLKEIYKMSVKQIEKKFEIYGEKLHLFNGYNNKLRNAIAHFSFMYDNNSQIMTYTDDYQFKKDGKTESWIQEYSQANMFWFNQKIVNVNELVTTLFGLLFIRDACFAGNTWK